VEKQLNEKRKKKRRRKKRRRKKKPRLEKIAHTVKQQLENPIK